MMIIYSVQKLAKEIWLVQMCTIWGIENLKNLKAQKIIKK